ncbi:elongation factor 4, partial [Candidatus Parcubacteria bacterium]|nr:elongation factor 4 [Candidatus Parcubacteria bacterium]
FSKIVKRRDMQREAQTTAKRLRDYLPRALFVIKIQVKAQGKILAAQKISALKKDVTGHLYGGDITRKQKLWKKQKKGKEKLKKFGKVNVPHDVFIKMVKGAE